MKAFTIGCRGTSLDIEERAFLRAERPWGLILFGRNVGTELELSRLVEDYRRAVDDERAPVLIDQEGGRVQRLRPPFAPDYPANAELGRIYLADHEAGLRATYLLSRLHAFDLGRFGIDIDCLPVLDVPVPGANAVIGDRAFGPSPEHVAALGRAACQGLLDGGVLPVIKHMPGHGRANADSHKALPTVSCTLEALDTHDFVPFRALADMPIGMSAHVRFTSIDPERPASVSPIVIETVIRQRLGFDGLLLSDDVAMNALSGDTATRTRELLAAGCDIALHCSGDLEDAVEAAEVTPELGGAALKRADRALARRQVPDDASETELRVEFRALTGRNVDRPGYASRAA